MYQPIKKITGISRGSVMGTMPTKGTNLRDFSQLLDATNALYLENYWVHGTGRLVKRRGTTLNFDTTESDEIPLWQEYQNDYEIVGYGTKVRAYDTAAGTFTNIKTDFSANNGGFDGVRAGDYFFVTNYKDGLWRISREISYSSYQNLSGENKFILTGGTGSISAGQTLTGGSSGKTAVVVSATGSLPAGLTLIVDTLSGNFTWNEPVSGGTLASNPALSQINPFTLGATITGQTSNATAIVLEDTNPGGTSGILTLGSINGTLQNGERLLDDEDNPGQGTATSTANFAIEHISGAPKARYILFGDNRLLLYNLSDDPAGWAYSGRDTGSNPPFSTWTVGTGFNDPGAGSYRNGEEALTASLLGNIFLIGFSKGYTSFSIDQTEISGVSSKYDNFIQTKEGAGIILSKTTDIGVVVCGKFGIKLLVSLGQSNIPYSDQWETLTEQLGEEYFADVDFSNGDIAYDEVRGYIYVNCAKGGGSTNNVMIACKVTLPGIETDVKSGATSFFTGLNPYKFLEKDGEIYFTSAIDGVTYHLFDGENDNGEEIYSVYYQELNFGTVTDTFNLDEFKCSGELSPASNITVSIDTFDENGFFQETRREYSWTTLNDYSGGGGWGSSPWGSTGWGGTGTITGLIYTPTGAEPKLRNLTRVRARFTCSDTADHVIAILSAQVSITHPTRNRKLTAI